MVLQWWNMIDKLRMLALLFDDYNYIATDNNGEVWVFKVKPKMQVGDMWKDNDHNVWLKINVKYTNKEWNESLVDLKNYRYIGLL